MTRWLYSIREPITADQFADLKFNVLPRYKHQASFSNDFVIINVASKRAAQVIGQSLGLTEINLYKPEEGL